MKKYYHNIPYSFNNGLGIYEENFIDLNNSITKHIELIIFTKFGENRYDRNYGFLLWDMQFKVISNEVIWLDALKKSFINTLDKYESRIQNINIEMILMEQEFSNSLINKSEYKKVLLITIRGEIVETLEPFNTQFKLYLNPISL